jgi:hypothetical protein
MGLNTSKGNMYDFVTHTWNTVKGECYHDCSYCYMKRWGKLKPARFDQKELKTDLGSNNFIFVGSSCDMSGFYRRIACSKIWNRSQSTAYRRRWGRAYSGLSRNAGDSHLDDLKPMK